MAHFGKNGSSSNVSCTNGLQRYLDHPTRRPVAGGGAADPGGSRAAQRRTFPANRITSGVASSVTTSDPAKGCVCVNLRACGNFCFCNTLIAPPSASWRVVEPHTRVGREQCGGALFRRKGGAVRRHEARHRLSFRACVQKYECFLYPAYASFCILR